MPNTKNKIPQKVSDERFKISDTNKEKFELDKKYKLNKQLNNNQDDEESSDLEIEEEIESLENKSEEN